MRDFLGINVSGTAVSKNKKRYSTINTLNFCHICYTCVHFIVKLPLCKHLWADFFFSYQNKTAGNQASVYISF